MKINCAHQELLSLDDPRIIPNADIQNEVIKVNGIAAYSMSKIGLPKHYVSKCGKVYTSMYSHGKDCEPREMRYQVVCGYKQVGPKYNKKVRYLKIHRVVAEMFIDNHDGLPQVNHIDGDKANNNVSNLEWVTAKQNTRHAINTGLRRSKSNELQMLAVKTFMETGFSDLEISKMFGFSRHYCNSLRNGHYWKEITCLK